MSARTRYKRWAKAHPDRVKELAQATYYKDLAASRAKKREAQRRYKAKHPNRVKASQRTYAEARKRHYAHIGFSRPRCVFCGRRCWIVSGAPKVCPREGCFSLFREHVRAAVVADALREAAGKGSEYYAPSEGWVTIRRTGGKRGRPKKT